MIPNKRAEGSPARPAASSTAGNQSSTRSAGERPNGAVSRRNTMMKGRVNRQSKAAAARPYGHHLANPTASPVFSIIIYRLVGFCNTPPNSFTLLSAGKTEGHLF
jgi:hypothetical protein